MTFSVHQCSWHLDLGFLPRRSMRVLGTRASTVERRVDGAQHALGVVGVQQLHLLRHRETSAIIWPCCAACTDLAMETPCVHSRYRPSPMTSSGASRPMALMKAVGSVVLRPKTGDLRPTELQVPRAGSYWPPARRGASSGRRRAPCTGRCGSSPARQPEHRSACR
jgi:hypothetical protein